MPSARFFATCLLVMCLAANSASATSPTSRIDNSESTNSRSHKTQDVALLVSNYDLERVRNGDLSVPRSIVPIVPGDLARITNLKARKVIFIQFMLPMILRVNERIEAQRRRLVYLLWQIDAGRDLDQRDLLWLDNLAREYGLGTDDRDELIRRVDTVPVSIFLAQAIIESGWGTSRFAVEGNALYGQRTWNESTGIIPKKRRSKQSFVVRTFSKPHGSVVAYANNLNQHPAYSEFRKSRAKARADGLPMDSRTLVRFLGGYAEEPDYVNRVLDIIDDNALTDFDDARLGTAAI